MSTIHTLEKRIDGFDHRFDVIDEKFDKIDQKFEKIENLIGGLVIMVNENFDRMVTKTDLENLARSTADTFAQMNKKFDDHMLQIDHRFDIIENISIGGHERRIENLEDDVRALKTKTGIK